jgi:flagellar basal body-associated protein FliL
METSHGSHTHPGMRKEKRMRYKKKNKALSALLIIVTCLLLGLGAGYIVFSFVTENQAGLPKHKNRYIKTIYNSNPGQDSPKNK